MSYEEIDKSIYGTDVFTKGTNGRYTKPKLPSADDTPEKPREKKKKAPKAPSSSVDDAAEQAHDNGHNEDEVKTKKKSHKTHENDGETTQAASNADGEPAVKPKKKKAPKVESNSENIDSVPDPPVEEEPVKKKKSKAPKATSIEDDIQALDTSTINDVEATPKVKKSKKSKTPKHTTDTFDDTQLNDASEYAAKSELDGAYGSTNGDIPYDLPPPYPTEGEQMLGGGLERSEYETAIREAFDNLASKVSFTQYVGDDKWTIIHPPKSARVEPKSRIRKMLPGTKDERGNVKPIVEKSKFFKRLSNTVNTLVRDEKNLLFGDRLQTHTAYYEEEEDGVDTDDLHRYAQKLRELEDTDREVNPEFLVLRDGKTVYGVHEADAEGKMTLSTRKPIYDRYGDQAPDDEPAEKKKLLSRFKLPFGRNKDKDNKGSNSPKSADGTPDTGKRHSKKSTYKTIDDDLKGTSTGDPLVD